MIEWISVDDGLPEKGKFVLVAIYGSDICVLEDGETAFDAIKRQIKIAKGRVTLGFIGSDGWYECDGFPLIITPSFWSDLPEPPTLEGDE